MRVSSRAERICTVESSSIVIMNIRRWIGSAVISAGISASLELPAKAAIMTDNGGLNITAITDFEHMGMSFDVAFSPPGVSYNSVYSSLGDPLFIGDSFAALSLMTAIAIDLRALNPMPLTMSSVGDVGGGIFNVGLIAPTRTPDEWSDAGTDAAELGLAVNPLFPDTKWSVLDLDLVSLSDGDVALSDLRMWAIITKNAAVPGPGSSIVWALCLAAGSGFWILRRLRSRV